ncbi:hypothetical protein J2Z35_002692 [Acetoanaerobium pronyense]|uniref:Gamma-glutamylcyclotransferase AIG2-like domain-containing protein n=1 Tax=Acetoanaerobium pronyense TaxID=1482736 RepID=A0ABS4KM53_9FIRM|nr:gamma-glutamylcyclotransferase family protein [Acetoanaerobium pronyense]MBP2028854.1 hypothetical protein [Acetoanaerobium pronyense]
MKRLYGAYGSNLNLKQMKVRCPNGKVYGKGVIKNYRLLFKGLPLNSYATIEPENGQEVPVLIWELEEEDEEALDFYEGYPRFYEKELIEVHLQTKEVIKVMVYIMTDNDEDRININTPSLRYLNSIKDGYLTSGFDLSYLDEAVSFSKLKGGKNNG